MDIRYGKSDLIVLRSYLALTLNGSSFAADSAQNEPLAEVNGEVITAKDLEARAWREALEARGADLRPQASGT